MDKVAQYQNILQTYLETEAKVAEGEVPRLLVVEASTKRYLLFAKGWVAGTYVHHCIYHLEIVDGKVWIYEDLTEAGIAYALADLGVLKEDIVLGYFTKEEREMSDFASS